MRKVLVVLSGGQDSTTCLYWAKKYAAEIHAVTFNYGQRHEREIEAARIVGEMAGVKSHEFIDLGPVLIGSSPLVNRAETLEQYASPFALPGGLEKTFVPGRNALFLIIAANRAYALGCTDIVTGVCEEDFGGYPDCRRVFIDSMEQSIREGFAADYQDPFCALRIHTPLMHLSKAATVNLAADLPGCWEALAYTHTAYDGAYPPTGKDHATLLREKGFIEANRADPLVVRAWREGLMELPATANYDALRAEK